MTTSTPRSVATISTPFKTKTDRSLHKHQSRYGYALIAPMMLGFVLFSFCPIVAVFILSLFRWNLLSTAHFIGLHNYLTAFNDSNFWQSLETTAMYAVYNLPIMWVVAFGIALILSRALPGRNAFRTIFLIPWVTTPIAVASLWRWLLAPIGGVINYFTAEIGLGQINWFSSTNALRSIALVGIWQYTGYFSILFLVGLQAIPIVYYEAAAIDGAGSYGTFRRITIPLMRPSLMFVGVTSILGSFQVFDIVFGLTQGGPGTSTRVLYYYIYQQTFSYLNVGYAATLCVLLFVLLLAVTATQVKFFSSVDME